MCVCVCSLEGPFGRRRLGGEIVRTKWRVAIRYAPGTKEDDSWKAVTAKAQGNRLRGSGTMQAIDRGMRPMNNGVRTVGA